MRLSELWLKLQVVHKLNVKIRQNVYTSGIVDLGLATWHFYWSIISRLTNQQRYHTRDLNNGWTLKNLQWSYLLFPYPLLKAFLFCTFKWNTVFSNFYAIRWIISCQRNKPSKGHSLCKQCLHHLQFMKKWSSSPNLSKLARVDTLE